jgi:enoyl-CoA hydratase/carnithine racemase
LHALGVVNTVVAPGTALETAVARATALAAGPPQALAAIKRLIEAAPENTMEAQLALEAECIARAIGGAEGREGLAAFLEKRKPVFRPD